MALPNTNLSVTAVKKVLGVSSNDIGTLCTHSNINKWSRWKPIRMNKVTPLTDSDLISKGFGLNSPIGTTNDYTIALQSWFYNKPRGNLVNPIEPYRLGDFRGYNHQAEAPFLVPKPDPFAAINPSTIFNVTGESPMYDPSQISLYELDGELGIGSWYFGILFRTPIGEIYIKTADENLQNLGYTVTFPSNSPFFDYTSVELYFVLADEKVETVMNINSTGLIELRPIPSETRFYTVSVLKEFSQFMSVDFTGINKTYNGTSINFYNFLESYLPENWFMVDNYGEAYFDTLITNWTHSPFLLEALKIRMGVTKILNGNISTVDFIPQMYTTAGVAINSLNIPAGASTTVRLGNTGLFTEQGLIYANIGDKVLTQVRLKYALYNDTQFLDWYIMPTAIRIGV